ncbi:LOW QUALITY PROTEIN: hypothetical protein TorRG33x02_352030 [Trema orientale]|uniref:Uncharacterized protein n=1 Tax=Trema orientale TaxID=63057 RepID=A0A2P5AF36_TREOI|nr:LOW QUALITY PROTEIN: hypothetical protein TorRG33x02_352030 [Trema orientale]
MKKDEENIITPLRQDDLTSRTMVEHSEARAVFSFGSKTP